MFQEANELEVNYRANTPGSRKYVEPTKLNADELAKAVGDENSGVALPAKFLDEHRDLVHPNKPQRFEFFIDAAVRGAKDIQEDAEMRLLTLGRSVFVEKHESLSGNTNVFGSSASAAKGAALSDQWTKGIEKAAANSGPLAGEDLEGVDSEEWSD